MGSGARVSQELGQQLHRHGEQAEREDEERKAAHHKEGPQVQPRDQAHDRARLRGTHELPSSRRVGSRFGTGPTSTLRLLSYTRRTPAHGDVVKGEARGHAESKTLMKSAARWA